MNHRLQHAQHASWFFGRRRLLQAGCLAGLDLAGLLRAEDQAERKASRSMAPLRSCILLFYYGGPSHLDTWDMKPAAPLEVRGEFQSIATRVPGVRICEHLPRSARIMDRLVLVRGMHHPMRNHNAAAVEALCGRTPLQGDLELLADDANSFPCYGSALSAAGTARRGVPAHVALPHVMHNVVTLPGQNAGFLGAAYNPLQVHARSQFARVSGRRAGAAGRPVSDSAGRSAHVALGHGGPGSPRGARAAGQPMTTYQQRAFNLLYSETTRQAFDVTQEPAPVRERYGRHTLGQSLLLARRLVEAGVRFVNVNDKVHNGQVANWDSHENNFGRLKNDLLPPADQAFAALIEDLEARGLLESTLVVALAEFGRSPRINASAGRDHWPDCFSIVLAGGGVQGGAVHGASDRLGAYPASDAVTPGDLAATLFWRFGVDPAQEVRDRTGRPYRLAEGQPLQSLFGGQA